MPWISFFRLLQRFYASLSDIKAEVEAVLRDGRQQVEEGSLDDPINVSSELDAMKALYNRVRDRHIDNLRHCSQFQVTSLLYHVH